MVPGLLARWAVHEPPLRGAWGGSRTACTRTIDLRVGALREAPSREQAQDSSSIDAPSLEDYTHWEWQRAGGSRTELYNPWLDAERPGGISTRSVGMRG